MRRRTLGVALTWVLVTAAWGQEPPGAKDDHGMVVHGATLSQLVEDCQKQAKRRFVYDDTISQQLQKKVHVSFGQMPKDVNEYIQVFNAVLQVNKLVAIPVGKPGEEIYKIMPMQTAVREPAPVVRETTDPNDSYVTRIFTLKFASTRDVHTALLNLAQPQQVVVVETAGVIIVTDYDHNIKRLEEIITTLDVKKPDIEFEMIHLERALATDVEQMLNGMVQTLTTRAARQMPGVPPMPGQPGAAAEVKIAADKRTNSLVVLADLVRMEQIKDIVKRLDSEAPFETSGIYIEHLRHSNAIDVARTISALYKISIDDKGLPSGGSSVRPGQAVAPQPPGPSGTQGSTGAVGVEPTIVADTRTNAIIIIADRNTADSLKTLIKRLDTRRPQVLIKATVVEVRATDDFDLGVELGRAVDPENRLTTFLRSQYGQSMIVQSGNSIDIVPFDTTGLTLALVHDRIGNIGTLLKAMAKRANISILDEPEAATVDNGQAELTSKTSVPVLQQSVTTSGITQTTFNKFEEAKTTLTISPHINEGNYLRLETKVMIEKFVGVQPNPTVPPPKSSREITTEILVPNGRTVVIGGIVTQDKTDTVTKVPFLGDIPILGTLFRRTQENEDKRTLYIFITPHILWDDTFADFKEHTRLRKEDIEAIRSQALKGITLEGRGDPVPISAFRYRGLLEGEEPR
ncbi:MAG: hypothetical protein HYY16_02905 [Planctomycetes bacterium]|nr:hypothetical protein [Planctomycetota bacterium]